MVGFRLELPIEAIVFMAFMSIHFNNRSLTHKCLFIFEICVHVPYNF